MPEAKKEFYKSGPIDSIKQYLMMDEKNWHEGKWSEQSIKDHFNEMKRVLLNAIKSDEGGV